MLFICYPKCTTCKKAQKWLESKGVKYELRDIKTNKIIFRPCQVSQTTEKLFRKKYTVGTMSVLPYVWV